MMTVLSMSGEEFQRLSRDPAADGGWPGPVCSQVIVVDLDDPGLAPADPGFRDHLPAVVVGTSCSVAEVPEEARAWCDVLDVPGGELTGLIAGTVDRNPVACVALVTLLRRSGGFSVSQGLLAESAVYGTLQAGEEFRKWRDARPRQAASDPGPPVLAFRHDDVLHLTLNRPQRRNAFDAAMRDALAEQLALAVLDSTISAVRIDGAGAGFCSGGDLDEFGTATDPSVAHLIRLERSIGALIDGIRDRVTVLLHGPCVGSGIELAAFAGHISADSTVSISLPEVSMGLIPGAGGTVSMVRRVGRHRTCELALSGRSIDAGTALEWGLVDTVVDWGGPVVA